MPSDGMKMFCSGQIPESGLEKKDLSINRADFRIFPEKRAEKRRFLRHFQNFSNRNIGFSKKYFIDFNVVTKKCRLFLEKLRRNQSTPPSPRESTLLEKKEKPPHFPVRGRVAVFCVKPGAGDYASETRFQDCSLFTASNAAASAKAEAASGMESAEASCADWTGCGPAAVTL